jgi:hypothetical protein
VSSEAVPCVLPAISRVAVTSSIAPLTKTRTAPGFPTITGTVCSTTGRSTDASGTSVAW